MRFFDQGQSGNIGVTAVSVSETTFKRQSSGKTFAKTLSRSAFFGKEEFAEPGIKRAGSIY
jgi:hypothetical protein